MTDGSSNRFTADAILNGDLEARPQKRVDNFIANYDRERFQWALLGNHSLKQETLILFAIIVIVSLGYEPCHTKRRGM